MPPTVAYLMCDSQSQRRRVQQAYVWLIRRGVQLADKPKWLRIIMPYARLFG